MRLTTMIWATSRTVQFSLHVIAPLFIRCITVSSMAHLRQRRLEIVSTCSHPKSRATLSLPSLDMTRRLRIAWSNRRHRGSGPTGMGGEGRQVMKGEHYREREKRFEDAIALRMPDRVPVIPRLGF